VRAGRGAAARAADLFLDEPTIGMDVAMQLAIREFVRRYNAEHGATVILTSHYMEDVAALCPRIVVIDGGQLRFDGSIEALTRRIRPLRRVSVRAVKLPGDEALAELGSVALRDGGRLALDVAPERVPAVVQALLAMEGAQDLGVQDAPLEEVMRELFRKRGWRREAVRWRCSGRCGGSGWRRRSRTARRCWCGS
jgi:ABC-2 type transport system ATP-binding protein